MPIDLTLITFNIACGLLFTTNRRERMRAIGALLRDHDPDLVAIQEAFTRRDRAELLAVLADSRLRWQARFPAGVVGNGLLTLSAWPIVEQRFHRFRHNNPWYKVHQGDWWAGKGVGLTRIQLPEVGTIDLYNTHTQPDRRDPANLPVRRGQLLELARFINESRGPRNPVFALGDFNTTLGSVELAAPLAATRLRPLMGELSGIDFIFAADTPDLSCELLRSATLSHTTRGSHAAIFLDRAPTPAEYWRMTRGPGQMTPLSDHPAYLSRVRLCARLPTRPRAAAGEAS